MLLNWSRNQDRIKSNWENTVIYSERSSRESLKNFWKGILSFEILLRSGFVRPTWCANLGQRSGGSRWTSGLSTKWHTRSRSHFQTWKMSWAGQQGLTTMPSLTWLMVIGSCSCVLPVNNVKNSSQRMVYSLPDVFCMAKSTQIPTLKSSSCRKWGESNVWIYNYGSMTCWSRTPR